MQYSSPSDGLPDDRRYTFDSPSSASQMFDHQVQAPAPPQPQQQYAQPQQPPQQQQQHAGQAAASYPTGPGQYYVQYPPPPTPGEFEGGTISLGMMDPPAAPQGAIAPGLTLQDQAHQQHQQQYAQF